MGLAVRIIPTLLHKSGQLVKGRGFKSDRVVGHALQAARIHESRHVDELCIFDVVASLRGRGPDFTFVEQLTADCFMPITYGGGIRSVEDVQALLDRGADKVSICSHLSINFVEKIAHRFGSQVLVVSVDVNNGIVSRAMGKGVEQYAKDLADAGAGEIMLQCIERDGTMRGYDLGLIERVSQAVDIPVIASGGCKGYGDMVEAIKAGASAVAVGALFQFTKATPKSAAEYLHNAGIEVRL